MDSGQAHGATSHRVSKHPSHPKAKQSRPKVNTGTHRRRTAKRSRHTANLAAKTAACCHSATRAVYSSVFIEAAFAEGRTGPVSFSRHVFAVLASVGHVPARRRVELRKIAWRSQRAFRPAWSGKLAGKRKRTPAIHGFKLEIGIPYFADNCHLSSRHKDCQRLKVVRDAGPIQYQPVAFLYVNSVHSVPFPAWAASAKAAFSSLRYGLPGSRCFAYMISMSWRMAITAA